MNPASSRTPPLSRGLAPSPLWEMVPVPLLRRYRDRHPLRRRTGSQSLSALWLVACSLWLAAPAALAANLVPNGGFEKGDGLPEAWHVKLTDFYCKKQNDDKQHPAFRYICGCGQDLGDGQPYMGLICPKCKGFLCGQECGAWYVNNDKCVSLDHGAQGRCVKFTLPKDVGENQGVRIFSSIIKARKGWGYILDFDVKTDGALARVFVECYRPPKVIRSFLWDGGADPNAPKMPIERCHRAPVNCGAPKTWTHFTREVIARKRYQFEYMVVNLYAYMPGEVWYDNVSLRPMTGKEMKDFLDSAPKPKDKRFEY